MLLLLLLLLLLPLQSEDSDWFQTTPVTMRMPLQQVSLQGEVTVHSLLDDTGSAAVFGTSSGGTGTGTGTGTGGLCCLCASAAGPSQMLSSTMSLHHQHQTLQHHNVTSSSKTTMDLADMRHTGANACCVWGCCNDLADHYTGLLQCSSRAVQQGSAAG